MKYGLKKKFTILAAIFLLSTGLAGCKENPVLTTYPQEKIEYFADTKQNSLIITTNWLFIVKGSYRGQKAGTCLNFPTGKLYKFNVEKFLDAYPQARTLLHMDKPEATSHGNP